VLYQTNCDSCRLLTPQWVTTNTTSKIPLKTFLLLLLLKVVVVSLDDLSSPIQRLNLRPTDV